MVSFFQLLVPALEIATIAIALYYLLSFFWNTKAMDLIFGLIAFLIFYIFAIWFHLPVLEQLMYYFINVAVLAFLILFQPELRLALAKLSFKSKKYREMTEFDNFLDTISQTVYRLSERRIGALILLENHDPLDEYANKSVILNAQFSPELLESIFSTTTPLHDGAVIIRGTTILSAATILPLADDSSQLTKTMGTRHRAALGMSQSSDAVIIIVSEESGKVSIAREGVMTRGVKIDRFKGILRSIFTTTKESTQTTTTLWKRLLSWRT
jgi:uncharacterized protein (TIGR00159 family)